MKTSLRVLSTLCLSAVLVACSSSPSTTLGQLPSSKHNDVEKLLLQAGKKTDQQAIGLYLAAADLAWQQGQKLRAREILEVTNLTQASVAQQIFAKTLEAEFAVARQQASTALKILEHASFKDLHAMPVEQQLRTQLVRAQALEDTDQKLAAVRERIYLAPWLSGVLEYENHQTIWQLLTTLPSSQLQPNGDADFDGWLTLLQISKTSRSLAQQQAAITQWALQNINHPAAKQLPIALNQLQQLEAQPIQQIALLLPTQDANQNVVNALRHGFFAAHYIAQAAGQAGPSIRLYDSSKISSMDSFYRQAAQDGIDLVVGPWEKKLIAELAKHSELPMTTLALNYLDQGQRTPQQLFQYGLAAEDEARVAAERAWADGQRRAVALVPKNAWGERVLAAFSTHWQALGGELIATQHIDRPAALAGQIADLFKLHDSEARAKTLQATLDTKLAAQPARRQDVDFLFLAASPQQARQIKAALTFQYADDVPVYATSAVNSGSGEIYPELKGLQFSEMPWFVETNDSTRQSIAYHWPQANGSMGRFYAMGADAYQLAHQLQQLTTISNSSAVGLTGTLKINPEQRIERNLYWVKFTTHSIEQLKEGQRD